MTVTLETPPSEPSKQLHAILKQRFRLESFRKGQLDILLSVASGKDAMAVMPTGGGKSLCYQIPALYFQGLVVVISPLIALMKDQVRILRDLGVPTGCLHSGQSLQDKHKIFKEINAAPHYILYLSPERVQNPGFAAWIKSRKISLFAIDESHCVSQWGPDFRLDYHKLNLLRELRPDVPILALTATATPTVLRDIIHRLGLKSPDRHIYGFYRPNLYYQVEICEDQQFKSEMLRQALLQTASGRILIYCGTRNQCEDLVAEYGPEFPDMDFYHAGLPTEKRSSVQADYESGKTRILAATNAFGMGIDHPDVRLVVHYQMPANIESFYQEMGRAGRDGKPATCLLLYSKRDKGLHSYFIRQSEADAHTIDMRWRALDTMTQFAEGGECRHSGILTYFKDTQRLQSCGHCDSCSPASERRIQRPKPSFAGAVATLLKRTAKKVKTSTASAEESPLSPAEELRSEILKSWRKEYASEKDMPAFMIFSNKTLKDLARKAPRSLRELEGIHGLGPHKIEHYGPQILEQLSKCINEKS